MTAITLVLLAGVLTAREFAYGQQWQDVFITESRQGMADFQQKQNEILEALKGFEDLQQKQNDILAKLSGYEELLQKIPDIGVKLKTLEGMIHQQETKGCLGREDLEHFRNISSAGQNCGDHATCNDKFVHFTCTCFPGFAWDGSRCEDIDECSAQGEAECSPQATCRNSVGSYSCSCNPPFEGDGRTCSCPSGFAQNSSNCEDVDECSAQGKAECSPQATCRNSVGSYSCSCNPPFEGDGRTCEFPCESPAVVLEGLGCLKPVTEVKTFEEMKATCHQAGGRLLQDLTLGNLQEFALAISIHGGWVGVHERKWLESGLPLQEELWMEGFGRSDASSRREHCGFISRDFDSESFKVGERDCSEMRWGYCQFVTQQK